ncbi:hypothetical protein FACHB389_18710 [Nostoc calcicola FACHB-389]|nr:hypothetical protein FACHB389_18710 [Nostoc calcicola FACHB-389]
MFALVKVFDFCLQRLKKNSPIQNPETESLLVGKLELATNHTKFIIWCGASWFIQEPVGL